MTDAAAPRPSTVAEKVRTFSELVKIEHSVFALPYAYIGALYGAGTVTAESALVHGVQDLVPVTSAAVGERVEALGTAWPTPAALFWITVVMVGARAFAFVLNRAIDAEIDARNPRTATRAIPAGLVTRLELWLFSAVMLGLYVLGVSRLAPITWLLAPVPLVAFLVYPYTKRFTPLCHYWLGMCLGLAPVGGWVAVGGPVAHPAPWVIGFAVMLWTAGFDIIYATQDVECDRRDGVHSAPADFGVANALLQTRAAHVLTVALLALAGLLMDAGYIWFIGVAFAAVLLAYENSIVRASDLSRVDAAFFTLNGIIAIVVGAAALVDRLLA